jgi:hypothetical protein
MKLGLVRQLNEIHTHYNLIYKLPETDKWPSSKPREDFTDGVSNFFPDIATSASSQPNLPIDDLHQLVLERLERSDMSGLAAINSAGSFSSDGAGAHAGQLLTLGTTGVGTIGTASKAPHVSKMSIILAHLRDTNMAIIMLTMVSMALIVPLDQMAITVYGVAIGVPESIHPPTLGLVLVLEKSSVKALAVSSGKGKGKGVGAAKGKGKGGRGFARYTVLILMTDMYTGEEFVSPRGEAGSYGNLLVPSTDAQAAQFSLFGAATPSTATNTPQADAGESTDPADTVQPAGQWWTRK